jgi:hypothetical protein
LLAASFLSAKWLGMPFLLLGVTGTAAIIAPARHRAHLHAYALAVAWVVLAAMANRYFPLVWHMKQHAAAALSAASGSLVREARNLGPTAMALPILGAAVAVVIATTWGRARRGTWITLAVLLVVHFGFLMALTPYARWIGRHRPSWEGLLLNSQYVFLLLASVVLAVWERVRGAAAADPEPAPRRFDRATAIGFAAGALVVALVGRTSLPAPRPTSVFLYDAGYTNWKVPQHGSYGEKSGGMFGLLPGFLQAAGCRVHVGKDLQRLEGADKPDCVVLINIQEFLADADRDRIQRFVAAGGGLLCLGDHTGVAGIRGPFNDLLAPYGIRFRFDSASFFAGSWSDALERRHHPLNRGTRFDDEYQIWVGASLEIDPPAAPVVIARYGYSDFGDMANVQRSYLGDRVYNPSELLGDVVLVAETRAGRGKVMVFGDTSTYQNLALSRSTDVVLRSIRHLGQAGGGPASTGAQVLLLCALALALGMATGGGRRAAPVFAAAAGVAVTALLVHAATRPRPNPILDWSAVAPPSLQAASDVYPQRLALVDRSHGGRFDMKAWFDRSIGGLTLNLLRDGFFPKTTEVFPARDLERAALYVTIAPMRDYSKSERAALRRWMERGGRAIVCAGGEEFDGARTLLADYGLAVRDVPLAHFRTGERSEDLVFLEGWALAVPPAARVLVRQWGQPVVAAVRVGQGELILIGDTHFFHNRNLEGRETYFLGNIRFLSAIGSGLQVATIEGQFADPSLEPGPGVDAPPPVPPGRTP